MSWYQKKHSPTHHPDHHLIFISFFHLPQSIASSLFKLRAWKSFFHNLYPCPLWSTSWSGALHLIPYISSPNQCLLFATHAHTIATCFAVVSVLFHDLLLRSCLYHCVWSVITAHNLTPEKHDNNYSPHPLILTSCISPCCGCL